ncbi:Alpha-glucosidase [Fusarium oxysporum f. sp. albedinis]|nr:Alpha-glucosidase [Fusarium oxysporum f. sp. albedinis]
MANTLIYIILSEIILVELHREETLYEGLEVGILWVFRRMVNVWVNLICRLRIALRVTKSSTGKAARIDRRN